MAITKLQDLIAKVDCPYCFSLLTWDDIQDVQIVNGNKVIICPICGEAIQLDRKKDYWYESISDGGGITTEIDPVFSSSPAGNITNNDISNWNSKTNNIGTVTSVAVNGSTYQPDSNGSVNLGSISGGSGLQNLVDGSTTGSVRGIHTKEEGGPSYPAVGQDSFAIGYKTIAMGKGSVAEGCNSIATGHYSHAQGQEATSSGYASCSGGYKSASTGQYSFARGEGVISLRLNQCSIGAWNIKDQYGNDVSSKGKYIFIIGNGLSTSSRSNAFTVDWSGNTWTQGKMTVGTGPTDNMDVATKQYVDEAIAAAIANLNN